MPDFVCNILIGSAILLPPFYFVCNLKLACVCACERVCFVGAHSTAMLHNKNPTYNNNFHIAATLHLFIYPLNDVAVEQCQVCACVCLCEYVVQKNIEYDVWITCTQIGSLK